MKLNKILVASLVLGTVVVACKKDNKDDNPSNVTSPANPTSVLASQVVSNYADLAYANYKDALDEAKKMQTAISAFTSNPTAQSLETAKDAWLDAREPYGQTEAFRFSGGPIDTDLLTGGEGGPEGQINAWPLDEAHIDYVANDSGNDEGLAKNIINSSGEFGTIDKDLLIAQNENGSEKNIATGWHAIEFLLWGQDNVDPTNMLPGQRLYTDYTTADNAERRKTYLNVATSLLIDDLQSLADEWDNNGSNYRSQLLASDADEAVKAIVNGIAELSYGEFAQERIAPGVEGGQEDEHSCFSDNTHRDIILNAKGINNIYTGVYTDVNGAQVGNGTGIYAFVLTLNAELANEILALAVQSVTYSEAIPVPFDYAITLETRDNIISKDATPIAKAYNSLFDQGKKLANEVTPLLDY